ncbi:hypothetical protein GALMADRAFT_154764 [Galerina marginata CBS 339.88]|uniref:Uncharacterized protein n=1 Tax=Galerina marginata (strain CBS 339.88) TaxID=685588 RepID=A0A067TIR1_GALM3|nr:hypothetical protein GALMADRAFT_154764 [Galerina marginata CBS 339.88]
MDKTKIHLVSGLEFPGAAINDWLWDEISVITDTLEKGGIGPIVAWGDFALIYYGIPTVCTNYFFLVPDACVAPAHQALLDIGYVDNPTPRGIRSMPGDRQNVPSFEILSPIRNNHLRRFAFEGFSTCPLFNKIDLKIFEKRSGLAIPPLRTLAHSFAAAAVAVPEKYLLLQSLFVVWACY